MPLALTPRGASASSSSSTQHPLLLILCIVALVLLPLFSQANASTHLRPQPRSAHQQQQPPHAAGESGDAAAAAAAHALSLSRRGLATAQRLQRTIGAVDASLLSGTAAIGRSSGNLGLTDLSLGRTVLIATVDGALHALDRGTGSTLWVLPARVSQDTRATSSQPQDADEATGGAAGSASRGFGFEPLVGAAYGPARRSFTDVVADTDAAMALETLRKKGMYIVEPGGGGAIYVLGEATDEAASAGAAATATQDSSNSNNNAYQQQQPRMTMRKLPLTLPQLVDLSPFSFPFDSERVFVGHKSSSLVELDVRTGAVGAVFGGSAKRRYAGGQAVERENWCTLKECEEGEWTYVGRTDYTLTIHSRADPLARQTLRYSTFAPNAADREVAALWTSLSPSARARAEVLPLHAPNESEFSAAADERAKAVASCPHALLGVPEEGAVVCINATHTEAPLEEQDEDADRTLWKTQLGTAVAGIFDLVYLAADTAAAQAADAKAPILVPHPPTPLGVLFSDSNEGNALHAARKTYLGLAGGSLYALGSSAHPLAALAATAPASTTAHTASGGGTAAAGRKCASVGCWLGAYEADDAAGEAGGGEVEEQLLLGSRGPRLEIADHAANQEALLTPATDETTSSAPSSRPQGSQQGSIPPPSLPSTSAGEALPIWTWRPTPLQGLVQVIALLLGAILCGLIYIGLQEQRRQTFVDAQLIAREVKFVPAIFDEKTASKEEEEGSASALNGDTTNSAPTTAAEEASPPKVSFAPGETPVETLLEAEAASAAKLEKKRATRRRRRGKRAGAVVQARDGKRAAEEQGSESEEEEEGGLAEGASTPKGKGTPTRGVGKTNGSAVVAASTQQQQQQHSTSRLIENGWIDAAPDALSAGEQANRLAASVANNEGGSARKGGSSLVISEEVLGYGSSGTVVFKGTFQGRAVAVKRLLRDFVNVASKEVSLLESADNHPNVIRYFYKELTSSFLFIALELCPASLADVIEKPVEYRELGLLLEPKKALAQIASGLRHLHSLSIVHRDIKPQNILVSQTGAPGSAGRKLKMLLSDFGLSKRLDGLAQTSFSQTVNNPGGTVGWRAPEILRGDVSLDTGEGSASTESSVGASGARVPGEERRRLTRAVDVFALGCLAYYILANGEHPFGSRFEREMNIVRGCSDLSRLSGLGEEGHEAQHLVQRMISADPRARPGAVDVLAHPYFWDSARRLAFLQDASDRFEIMEKEAPPPALLALEASAAEVLGGDWHKRMDKVFLDDLGKFRKYERGSVQDLLRALRNKKHHYQDMSPQLRKQMGSLPEGFLGYFTRRFPALFLHVHSVVAESPLLRTEAMFAGYFKPPGDTE